MARPGALRGCFTHFLRDVLPPHLPQLPSASSGTFFPTRQWRGPATLPLRQPPQVGGTAQRGGGARSICCVGRISIVHLRSKVGSAMIPLVRGPIVPARGRKWPANFALRSFGAASHLSSCFDRGEARSLESRSGPFRVLALPRGGYRTPAAGRSAAARGGAAADLHRALAPAYFPVASCGTPEFGSGFAQ